MEQTLQETLHGGEEGERGGAPEEVSDAPEASELTDVLVQLKRKLKHSEEKHKIELEESKVCCYHGDLTQAQPLETTV